MYLRQKRAQRVGKFTKSRRVSRKKIIVSNWRNKYWKKCKCEEWRLLGCYAVWLL
jgi:hypothetical protein